MRYVDRMKEPVVRESGNNQRKVALVSTALRMWRVCLQVSMSAAYTRRSDHEASGNHIYISEAHQ